ncbi:MULTISPECIES: hypothetical protein [Streptomyces]|uniref:hypothetical protein n=1 Tax=Streptomyces TaxID=1883 RepID=UPI00159EBE7E|nr:hypothetical protein [Streptomyces sp. PTY087I2]
MPLAKRGDLADLFYRGEQFVGDALGFVALGGQGEGAGRFGKDAGAPCWTTPRSRICWLGRASVT